MPNTNSTQRLPSLYAGGQAHSSPSSAAECEDTSLTDQDVTPPPPLSLQHLGLGGVEFLSVKTQ